ncbi:MAG: YggS family pyridoxal phosphate-dependent enzyme [Acidimicrobiia bacterium]|nr:YggS family pyridoxal phosphate-dependent enzyme [Acidimicrobiia bacterium]
MIVPDELVQRIGSLRERIDAAGGSNVELVAVTKGFGLDVVETALAAGLVDLGENYSQELEAKVAGLAAGPTRDADPRWHFIGRLQRNKVRRIADEVWLWQTVDRVELATEIARRAPGARVLVQVNVSHEESKGGCAPDDAEGLVAAAVDAGLDVRGLMTVGRTGSPDDAREGFALLRRLCDRLELPECSMGMSGDLEVAVGEGATMVRVGTALFGPRPVRGSAAEA